MRGVRYALVLMLAVQAVPLWAQTYPSKSIRLVNPFPAGGPADAVVRPIAQRLSETTKVQWVVDNRAGVNGVLGSEIAVRAPADGYTLLIGSTSSLPMNAAIYPKLPFDPLKDLAPVSAFTHTPQVMVVHPSVPAKTVKELIALGRARQGQIVYASPGVGSSPHFAAEMFSSGTGVKMLHVPYRGGALVIPDIMSGRVMLYFGSLQNLIQHVRANRLRALGMASLKRIQAAPEIPTIAESGLPGYEVSLMFGLFAPAGTPREIVRTLHGEVVRVLAAPDVRERLINDGAEVIGNSPEEFAAYMASETTKWAKVARDAGIKAE